MEKRKINELPDGIRNRMIRLSVEFALLSDKNIGERVKALDEHCLSYRMWQTRSYHLMKAVNAKLVSEGKPKKYDL